MAEEWEINGKPIRRGPMPALEERDMPEVLDALRQTGTFLHASKRFNITGMSLSRFCKRHPEYKAQVEAAIEEGQLAAVEQAERNIVDAIGHAEDQNLRVKTSQWWLTNSPAGKNKGYGNRQEISSAPAFDPAQYSPKRPDSWDEMRTIYKDIGPLIEIGDDLDSEESHDD